MRTIFHFRRVADTSFQCEWVEGMQRRSIVLLEGKQCFEETLCILRIIRDHAKNILRRVAYTDAARTKSQLVIRKIARPLPRGMTLMRVMDINCAVERRVGCFYLQDI